MHNMNMWLNAFCVFVHLHINTKPVHFGFVEENTLAVTALLSPPPPPLLCAPCDSSNPVTSRCSPTLLNTNDCPSAPAAIKDSQLVGGERRQLLI